MDLRLTEEQQSLYDTAYKFAQKEWEPKTLEIDDENRFPLWLWDKLKENGWLGLLVPEEYGGAGLGLLETCLIMEAAVRAGGDVGSALTWGSHLTIGSVPILTCGNEAQKEKYLPKLASGEWMSCFMLTEPNVGSDAAGVETTAERKGDYYIVNGTKTFITNAAKADVGMLMASTDLSKKAKGITAFMVDMHSEGITIGEPFDKIGPRGSEQSEVHFNNVKVPVEDRILEEGEGFIKVGVTNLEFERTGLASIWTGLQGYSIDLAVKYACEREQFGHKIAEFPQIRDRIAQMRLEYDISKLLMYQAASKIDNGEKGMLESTEYKVYNSQACIRTALEAMQIFGGYSLIKEYKIERSLRDAKLSSIGAGSEQMLLEIIARATTGVRSMTF